MSQATSAPAPSPIADPGPLGLAAFALTTAVLSVFNAGLITDAALVGAVLPLALFYGGLAQFAAGMWEFRRGNTFGATAFSSYGAFWLAYAGYAKFVVPTLPPATAHQATGLFLIVWAVFTAYMAVAALRLPKSVLVVFVLLALTFLLLALGEFAESTGLGKTGGWVGLATALAAWYASAAGVVNTTFGRSVVPVG